MIYLKDDGFGQYNRAVVEPLIAFCSSTLDALSGIRIEKNLIVVHWDNSYPMCCDREGLRIIFLTTKDNYWCQWMYQFAHEYCHHLIDGKMHGETGGLAWFEECLCHTSSLFCLSELSNHTIWEAMGYPRYALSCRDYIEDMRSASSAPLHQYLRHPQHGICPWIEDMQNAGENHRRDLYNLVSFVMLPHFLRNRRLWMILRHIGDSTKWQSLEDLFYILEANSDSSYSDDLRLLKLSLLGTGR